MSKRREPDLDPPDDEPETFEDDLDPSEYDDGFELDEALCWGGVDAPKERS